MIRMIAHCQGKFEDLGDVRVTYPFSKNPPSSNGDYWGKFDRIFDDEDVCCGIVGLVRPDPHWIVIRRAGKKLEFVNSHPTMPTIRKIRKSLHAGRRRRNRRQWLIERRELIVFKT